MREAILAACARPGVVRTHFQPIVDLARGVATGYEALSRFNGPPDTTPDVWFAAADELGLGPQLEVRALQSALAARASLPANCFLTVNVGPASLLCEEVQDVLLCEGDLRGLVAGIDEDETKAAVIETLGIFASRLDAWLLAKGVETPAELERLIGLRVPLAQGYGLGRPSPAMSEADEAAAAICRRRGRLAGVGDVAELAEIAPVVRAGAGDGALGEAFLRHPSSAWVAVVDEFSRPVALAPRAGAGRRRPVTPLCVTPGERITDVVRRVITRGGDERLAPVAACDQQCRLLGLVPVERLFERLADELDGRGRTRTGDPHGVSVML